MTREDAIKVLNMVEAHGLADEAKQMAIQALSQEPTEKPMCDRNICISNEYNGIGCDECVVNKPQEPCDDAISRESVDRILRDMGMNCAYDMPSFWANKGKDYKVIPTKWHKGYQQAVADFDKRIRELPSVTQKSDNKYRKEAKRWKNKWLRLKSQKSGKWIREKFPHKDVWMCSECGRGQNHNQFNYCPNCGCRMVEPQERSDKE